MNFCREFMLILGLLCCCLLAALAYFTYEAMFGHVTFCSLWIDVPGRLTLFLICYYVASLCGFLPLPRKYRFLSSFIKPFVVWRLESWNCLFRNLCLPILSFIFKKRRERNTQSAQNSLETPLLQENNQESYLAQRSQTEPIDITSPRWYVGPPAFVPNPEISPKRKIPEINKESESFPSIDPSVGDIAVPVMQGKSSKRLYPSKMSNQKSVPPDDSSRMASEYHKRYTETKWTGETAANILVPLPDYTFTADERPKKNILDKKSSIYAHSEKLVNVGQEELQNSKAQTTNAVKSDYATNVSRRQLEEKSATLANYEKHVGTKHLEEEIIWNKLTETTTLNKKIIVFSENKLRFNQPVTAEQKPPPAYIKPPPAYRTPPPAYMKPSQAYIKLPPSYRKPPPAYHEAKLIREAPNTVASVLDDFVPTNARPQDGKYFALADDEKPKVLTQKEELKLGHEIHKIHTIGQGLRGSTEKEPVLKTNDQSAIHEKNQQPTRKIARKEEQIPMQLNKTESQLDFSKTQAINRQTEISTVSIEQESPAKHRDSETSLNFPRIPWRILRNRGRVPAAASAIHRRNVELERREMNRYSMRQKLVDKIKSTRSALTGLTNYRITEAQLQKSGENIKLIGRSSLQCKNRSVVVEGKIEQTEVTVKSGNTSHAQNRCDSIRKEEIENVKSDSVSNRHCSLSSQKFKVKESTLTQTEEKIDFKVEIEKTRHRTMSEPDPLSLSRFKQDTERVKRIAEETADESFRKLKLENLKKRIEQINPHPHSRLPVVFETKAKIKMAETSGNKNTTEANISTKPTVEIQTKDTGGHKDNAEANISTKPTVEIQTKDMGGHKDNAEVNISTKPTVEIQTKDRSGHVGATEASISTKPDQMAATEKTDIKMSTVSSLSKSEENTDSDDRQ